MNDYLPLLLEQLQQISVTNSQIRLSRQQQLLAEIHIEQLYTDNSAGQHRLYARTALAQQALVVPLLLQANYKVRLRLKISPAIFIWRQNRRSQNSWGLYYRQLGGKCAIHSWNVSFSVVVGAHARAMAKCAVAIGVKPAGLATSSKNTQLRITRWRTDLAASAGWLATPQSGGLQLHSENQPWRNWQLQLDKHAAQYAGQMDPLQLSELTPLAGLFLPTDSVASEALRTLAPQGQLNELRFSRDAKHDNWLFTGQLQQMQWQRWKMVPGLHQIDAVFSLSPKGVALSLKQLEPQSWDLQPYFEKPGPYMLFRRT